MSLPKEKRSSYFLRTLDHLNKQFKEFQEKGHSDIKKAKNFFNVIQSFMLEIQLDQVNTVMLTFFLKPKVTPFINTK